MFQNIFQNLELVNGTPKLNDLISQFYYWREHGYIIDELADFQSLTQYE